MVVSGLGLLLGARADAGLVRAGAPFGGRRGRGELPPGHPAQDRAVEAGADAEDGSRSWCAPSPPRAAPARTSVAGPPPSASCPRSVSTLVAVHGQADQWRLRQPDHTGRCSTSTPATRWPEPLALGYQSLFDDSRPVRAERARLREGIA